EQSTVKKKIMEIITQLLDNGAFFSRPYGLWAKDVFYHHSIVSIETLKKVKEIFDPNHVLNPGVLCFDD
ncbi:MAG: FAD-linked oxidase C-terminal domain-containing protein, partial [Promethearchaeota archaeon]